MFALRCLSRKNIEAAIERRRVPIAVLAEHARWLLESAEPAMIPPLLKPLLAGERLAGTANHAYAFDVLLDAYDALGKQRAKRRLVDEMIAESPRGVLRSGAAQHLAAIRMDEGDRRGAWEAFEAASRDDPNSPSLSNLEVQLLVAQNEPGRGGAGAALREWLDRVAGRPVPRYELAVDAGGAAGDASPDPEPALEHAHTLRPPRSLVRMEDAWREVFPLDKPFSTHPIPLRGDFDPWEENSESMWSDFLEGHPEAFDSLDVLDDLATAVCVADLPDEFNVDKRRLGEDEDVKSLITVPLLAGGEVMGLLGFDTVRAEKLWSENELNSNWARPRKWRPWGSSPAVWRTTSTTC